MPVHPNSLRNLRPWKLGETGNSEGVNGSIKSRRREALLWRTVNALDQLEDEDLRQKALRAIARLVIDGAMDGVKRDGRVLLAFLKRVWPEPPKMTYEQYREFMGY